MPETLLNPDRDAARSTTIDPHELEIALRVIEAASSLDHDDPAYIALRRQTGKLYKDVKRQSRKEKRQRIADADRAVVAATATGAPDRIDDETRGIPLQARTAMPFAGELIKARACYICKEDYTLVDAFLPPALPRLRVDEPRKRDGPHRPHRQARPAHRRPRQDRHVHRAAAAARRRTHDDHHALPARRGAPVLVAARQCRLAAARLKVVGIDLRDPAQVIGLAESVASDGPLDILINKRRADRAALAGCLQPLVDAELAPLPDGPLPELVTFGHTNDAHPLALAQSVSSHPILASAARTADELTAEAMAAGSSSLERLMTGTAIDAGGLIPDEDRINSWTQHVDQVEPLEMLEVQLANMTAPFLLVSRLRPAMAASTAKRKYIVNVSAMEGVFGRGYKGPGHPHTNMPRRRSTCSRARAPARCSSRTAS